MTGVSPIDTQPASRVGRADGISRRAGDEGVAPAGPARRGGVDRVEVSDTARYLAKLRDLPAVRQDLVDRVRGEIEAGVYESPEKIEQAIDELVEDLI